MFYFEKHLIQTAFDDLKNNIENKFVGILGILKSINSDEIIQNRTYSFEDGVLSKWLDDTCYLEDFGGKYGTTNLYVKFSNQWKEYIKNNFIKSSISIYSLIIFLYKFQAFDQEPSLNDLLSRFCKDYHVSKETVLDWFVQDQPILSFTQTPISKQTLKQLLGLSAPTLSFVTPYSVSARAGELSRAPFIQTLYAGMDSIKCLLILKDDIDTYYSSGNNVSPFKGVHPKLSSYRPYITAIKSKPFLLLAGISGTGKSRIVRELARACWEYDSDEYKLQTPPNFKMVQVKPNWHDSTELIGYISRVSGTPIFVPGEFLKFVVKAWEHTEVPYFLCLDEMNLAPVEQYFAEYLSVIESRKNKIEDDVESVVTDPLVNSELEYSESGELKPKQWYDSLIKELLVGCPIEKHFALTQQFLNEGISIPQNLIVVGTVNMDETTFSFSRKVLDRAMTIEMNEVDLHSGLTEEHNQIGLLSADDLIGIAVEGKDVYSDNQEVCEVVISYLQTVNQQLEGTPFKVAYRTRNEFLLYVINNMDYNKDSQGKSLSMNYIIARALDEITSMKILSRIEGDSTKVTDSKLKALIDTIELSLNNLNFPEEEDEIKPELHLISVAKLQEMRQRLNSGYTSFWS